MYNPSNDDTSVLGEAGMDFPNQKKKSLPAPEEVFELTEVWISLSMNIFFAIKDYSSL